MRSRKTPTPPLPSSVAAGSSPASAEVKGQVRRKQSNSTQVPEGLLKIARRFQRRDREPPIGPSRRDG